MAARAAQISAAGLGLAGGRRGGSGEIWFGWGIGDFFGVGKAGAR